MGPPALVPTWWTRTLVERVRSCLDCDAVMLGASPVVVSLSRNQMGRPDRIVLEYPGSGEARREVPLGRAARLVDEPTRGNPSAAVLGDVLAVVTQLGSSEYVAYFVDAKRMRLRTATRLRLPELSRDGLTSSHPPAIAAGPDRFGIAIGHSDELVWLELDASGKQRSSARVLDGVSETEPRVAWNGQRFAVLLRRHEGSELASRLVPQLWTVSPDATRIERLVGLEGNPNNRGAGTWHLSGRLTFENGAYFVAAKLWPESPVGKEYQHFALFRIGVDGTVEQRACEDIDEE